MPSAVSRLLSHDSQNGSGVEEIDPREINSIPLFTDADGSYAGPPATAQTIRVNGGMAA